MRGAGRTPSQWAEIIRARWQETVKGIFETALYLETAHEELGAEAWVEMVTQGLGWSKQTGYRLKSIAEDDRLQEVTHALLPHSWDTLYQLTRLSDDEWNAALANGAIHPRQL